MGPRDLGGGSGPVGLAAAFKSLRGEKRRKEEEKRTDFSRASSVPRLLSDLPEGLQRKIRG